MAFPVLMAGERRECSSGMQLQLLPLFHAIRCALVGAVVCTDPSEMGAVPDAVGLVVFPRHFCQSTNGCCSLQAADSNQCVCVSFGTVGFFL